MTLKNLVSFDIETSGPNLFQNELLSISLVPFNDSIPSLNLYLSHDLEKIAWGGKGKEFFSKYELDYHKNKINLNQFISKFEDYININFTNEIVLVGHNPGFDYFFLKKVFHKGNKDLPQNISHRLMDTHSILLFLNLQGKIEDKFLSSEKAFKLVDKAIVDSIKTRHTSQTDALLTMNLMKFLLER